ncbi:MAG TPA: thioredoxin domain-containing protein, partial [Myxococcus sp.]|nr:thioredoxin domain-containing protein [Myxococcus sp.]
MWKMFVSAAVLAVSDRPPETLTESQRGLYMLGVKAGGTVEPFAPTPGELARFRAGFESQLEGSGQPVDERTLIRHLMALDALRERRNPASKPPPGEEAVAEVRPEEAVKHEEPSAPPPVYRQVDIPEEMPTAGPKDAKVTLVVWCDFGNACRKFYGHAKRLLNAYPRELRLGLRFFFPPNDISRDSLLAEAVLAAHEQGRFLDYLDALSPYRPLDMEGEISRQAEQLGLDMDRFQEAVGLRRFRPQVEADTAEGKALGVTADSGYGFSPVLFINGREQRGYHAPLLEKLIVEEKARAERLLASGTAPEEVYARLIEGGQKPGPIEAPAT